MTAEFHLITKIKINNLKSKRCRDKGLGVNQEKTPHHHLQESVSSETKEVSQEEEEILSDYTNHIIS